MRIIGREGRGQARRNGARFAVALLLLAGTAGVAHAGPVFKCVGAAGEVAYQDEPCALAQRESLVAIEPAPAWQPSPEYAVEQRSAAPAHAAARSRRAHDELVSYECRAADGQVFYRHSGCPHAIASGPAGGSAHYGGTRSAGSGSVAVSAIRVTRADACREIGRAGAIGRSGHAYDEVTPTYDRNLGRDPCR